MASSAPPAESCRKAVRERVLKDMLGSVQDSTGGGWRVLVVDDVTTRVLSSSVRMSDILDANISVVEDLAKTREPLPLAAVYFISPSPASVARLVQDFTPEEPAHGSPQGLYPSVHIFFSSKVSPEVVDRIKKAPLLLKALKSLKEVNMEFLTIDSRTMVTDHPAAAIRLLGEAAETHQRAAEAELDAVSGRLATLFAALNEFPAIRYQVGRPADPGDAPGQAQRASLNQRLAQSLLDKVAGMQRAGALPAKETCDMLILDRTYDAVAPVIHEWTYECLVYDLLELEGNVYRFKVESASGKVDEKEHVLEEWDSLWAELRHEFIADVYTSLANRFKEFQAKNKAAKAIGKGMEKGSELSTGNIRQLIVALPQFRDVLSRLSLHIQISSELKTSSGERQLTDLGELEQDLVFGDKGSKDLSAFLKEAGEALHDEDKMRLLMCYLATHPDKLDAAKYQSWSKASGLSGLDMAAVCNLAYLGVRLGGKPEGSKESKGGLFGRGKEKEKESAKALRKKKEGEDVYTLARFDPLLREILEDMCGGKLSTDQFPYIRPPQADSDAESSRSAPSARTARSGLNWAKKEGGTGSGGAGGRRLIVFITGGIVRSEMRVVHQLAKASGRDIILGSTSVETPASFIELLRHKIARTPFTPV